MAGTLQKWYKLVLSARDIKICDCSPWCHAWPCLLVSAAESRQLCFLVVVFSVFLFFQAVALIFLILAQPVTSASQVGGKKFHRIVKSINPKLDY